MSLDYHEIDMQLATANDQIRELQAKLNDKAIMILAYKTIAQRQRENQELWKPPMTAFGHELQMALREIHSVLLDSK